MGGQVPGPPVSVIVPAYNVSSYIEETLRSVVAQNFCNWECIVVDDGSSDGTAVRVAGFRDPRLRLIRQANEGVSAARNRGFSASSGAAVLFLDADDLLHPTALARLHEHLAAHPAHVACFGTVVRTTEDGELEGGQRPTASHCYESGSVLGSVIMRRKTFTNGGQLLIRREVVRSAGGYDPRLRLNEDWEFWCRVAALGPIGYVGSEAEVLRLRVHPGSVATRLSPEWDNHRPSIEKVLSNPALMSRFSPRLRSSVERQARAAHMFEAGRQNFRLRRFRRARSLMLRALALNPAPKRISLFLLAQASQLLGKPLVGRLRFDK
jgi:glycosyltransferase involved in cell wall biosynthesis